MDQPRIAREKPYLVTLAKRGKTYFWCACGLSANQPFCDGSHKGTGFEPVAYKAKADEEEVLFCGCKQTGQAPFCDGTHNNLGVGYEEASAEEIAATADIPVTPRAGGETGKAALDGGCYVLTADLAAMRAQAGWRYQTVIGARDGARHLSQFLMETAAQSPAPVSFGEAEAVAAVLSGSGAVVISGRRFRLEAEGAFYVRAGEACTLEPDGESPMRLLVTVCPVGPAPQFLAAMETGFDESVPERVGAVDPAKRESMGDRFYQVLVGAETGSEEVTAFLGEIPQSRAAAHRHLYEEAIVILSGDGYMWTEGARAAVQPGDIIFLPAKQLHSLECTHSAGMRLIGMFYPAGSPAVNY